MKDLTEKLNEGAYYNDPYSPYSERLYKQMTDAWVPKSIIEIIKQTKFPNGVVKFDTLVETLCEIYKDKYNK